MVTGKALQANKVDGRQGSLDGDKAKSWLTKVLPISIVYLTSRGVRLALVRVTNWV